MPVGMYVPPARMTRSALMSTWPGADFGMKAHAPAMMTSCMIFGSPTAATTTMGVVGTIRRRSARHDSTQRIAVQRMVVGNQHPRGESGILRSHLVVSNDTQGPDT